jgi:hypothetical protein
MKLKYLKYWKEIPLLYSIAFILDPRGKMRGLFNVLQIMQLKIDHDYTAYYVDVKTEIYKLFNKYEEKFGSARTQRRATQPAGNTGKRKHAWGRFFWRSWSLWCCWTFTCLCFQSIPISIYCYL